MYAPNPSMAGRTGQPYHRPESLGRQGSEAREPDCDAKTSKRTKTNSCYQHLHGCKRGVAYLDGLSAGLNASDCPQTGGAQDQHHISGFRFEVPGRNGDDCDAGQSHGESDQLGDGGLDLSGCDIETDQPKGIVAMSTAPTPDDT